LYYIYITIVERNLVGGGLTYIDLNIM